MASNALERNSDSLWLLLVYWKFPSGILNNGPRKQANIVPETMLSRKHGFPKCLTFFAQTQEQILCSKNKKISELFQKHQVNVFPFVK